MAVTPLILVVDDDPVMRAVARIHLQRAGYDVDLANDGDEGLAKARARPPSAVVLDFAMPGLSGADVLRELRADRTTDSIPVVMVTAWRDEDDRTASEAMGATWVAKPILGHALVESVRQALGTTPGSGG